MRKTPNLPLARYIFHTSEQKSPQASHLFNLTEDWFNGGFSFGVDGLACFRGKLSLYRILGCHILRWAPSYGRRCFAMLQPTCGNEGLEQGIFKEHDVVFGEIPIIGTHSHALILPKLSSRTSSMGSTSSLSLGF